MSVSLFLKILKLLVTISYVDVCLWISAQKFLFRVPHQFFDFILGYFFGGLTKLLFGYQIVWRWRTTRQNIVKVIRNIVLIIILFLVGLIWTYYILFLSYKGGRYTVEDAKLIIVQILSVVAFFHLQGVVHHDLKPEVIVSWTWHLCILHY